MSSTRVDHYGEPLDSDNDDNDDAVVSRPQFDLFTAVTTVTI